jgi:hypothetical protein
MSHAMPRGVAANSRVSAGKDRPSDLTRYLCAAAYLDRQYSSALIREISSEPHRAVAPAPGCDVPAVLRHAHAARSRWRSREALLALLLIIGVWLSIAEGIVFLPLMIIAAWLMVLGFDLSARYGPRMQALREGGAGPGKAFVRLDKRTAQCISEAGAYADGNVTVYSGYSPFIGFGTEQGSWSFSFDVTKPGRTGEAPREFDVATLYEEITGCVTSLRLPGLRVEERVFADGAAIVDNETFLRDPLARPVARVSREVIDALKREPEEHLRPYLAIHSTSWRWGLIVSLFVRFEQSQSNLIVEGVRTIMCPLQERYRIIDTLESGPSLGEVLKLAAEAVRAPFALIGAPFYAVAEVASPLLRYGRLSRQNRQIAEDRQFDYGARISVRQQAADSRYQRFFQKQDASKVLKVAERRVLDGLVEFAQKHHIDTGDLVQHQDVIVNNGIMASGGARVESSSVASGKESRISLTIPGLTKKLALPRLDSVD